MHLSNSLKMFLLLCSLPEIWNKIHWQGRASGSNWVAGYWGKDWICFHVDASTGGTLWSIAFHSFQGIPLHSTTPMPYPCQTSWNLKTAFFFFSSINYALGLVSLNATTIGCLSLIVDCQAPHIYDLYCIWAWNLLALILSLLFLLFWNAFKYPSCFFFLTKSCLFHFCLSDTYHFILFLHMILSLPNLFCLFKNIGWAYSMLFSYLATELMNLGCSPMHRFIHSHRVLSILHIKFCAFLFVIKLCH